MVPMVLLPLLLDVENGELITFTLFIVAVFTDSIDGYVARRFNQVSDLGKFLDPLADKLLVLSILFILVTRELAPVTAAMIIIAREVVVISWRWRALRQGKSFSASVAAKIKTDCQWIGIALLLLFPHLPEPDFFQGLGDFFLYLAAAMAIYSSLEYLPSRRSLERKR